MKKIVYEATAALASTGLLAQNNTQKVSASTNSNLATKENVPYNDTKDILTKDDYHTNTVHFVYNGKTLATKKYSGYLNQKFDVKKDVPQGYQVKDSHLPTKFGFADQEYSVNLAKSVVPDKQTQLKFKHYSLASVQEDTPQQRLLNNGFIKTSVGYDKAWKNHKLRATKSSVIIANDNGAPGERSSYRETTVKNSPGGYGIDLSATINKNDIVTGNDILIGTIAISDNDDRFLRLSGGENTKTRDVYYHGQRVGYIWSQNNNIPSDFAGNYGRFSDKIDEVGYFLHITNTYNFAKDFEFTYHIDHSRAVEAWNNHYKYIRGTTPDNPMIENWVTVQNGQDKVYTNKIVRGNDTLYNQSEEEYLHQINTQNTFTNFNPSMYWHTITTNTMNVRDNQNEHISKVIKVQNTNDNPLVRRDDAPMSVHLEYDRIYDANGNIVDWVWRPYELYFKATNIADNLTPEEVQNEAKKLASKDGYAIVRSYNTVTNSYLIGYEMTPSEYVRTNINKQEAIEKISNAIKQSFPYNFYDHKYLDYTLEHYERNDFQPTHFWLELGGFCPQDDNKSYNTILTDVTPNAPHVPSTQGSLNPNGQSSSTAVYRPVELRFVDDDDAQRLIGSDSVIGVSGENYYALFLHYNNNMLKYKRNKNNKHYFM